MKRVEGVEVEGEKTVHVFSLECVENALFNDTLSVTFSVDVWIWKGYQRIQKGVERPEPITLCGKGQRFGTWPGRKVCVVSGAAAQGGGGERSAGFSLASRLVYRQSTWDHRSGLLKCKCGRLATEVLK